MDIAPATETLDVGSIPGRVKPRTFKISCFPAWRPAFKGQCEASTMWNKQVGKWLLDSKTAASFFCLVLEKLGN